MRQALRPVKRGQGLARIALRGDGGNAGLDRPVGAAALQIEACGLIADDRALDILAAPDDDRKG